MCRYRSTMVKYTKPAYMNHNHYLLMITVHVDLFILTWFDICLAAACYIFAIHAYNTYHRYVQSLLFCHNLLFTCIISMSREQKYIFMFPQNNAACNDLTSLNKLQPWPIPCFLVPRHHVSAGQQQTIYLLHSYEVDAVALKKSLASSMVDHFGNSY